MNKIMFYIIKYYLILKLFSINEMKINEIYDFMNVHFLILQN